MKMIFENKRGQTLNLIENPYFHLVDIQGHTTATSAISSVTIGGVDGDEINSIQAQPRTMILTMILKNGVDVENAKRAILSVIKIKQGFSIRWTQNDRETEISGVVESVDMPRWNNQVAMQVMLHCENPFWQDRENSTEQIDEAIGKHYFTTLANEMLYFPASGIPFGEVNTIRTREIENKGDVSTGLIIEIQAYRTVTNPIIRNQNGEFFGVGYGPLAEGHVYKLYAGDVLTINTARGNKSAIHHTAYGDTDVLKYIKPQSTWLQLEAGLNTISIDNDDDDLYNMSFSLIYKQKYI